jgi:hypothetical protein
MTSAGARRPIVFAGPSVAGAPSGLLEQIDLRPPIRRGDLTELAAEEPGQVLIIDGLFGTSLAVTVTECRELLEHGWDVVGAGSIGALRAAELFSMGMVGVGDIYTLLRLGVIRSDADLAVAYDPDTYRELTVSLVEVRAALGKLGEALSLGRREEAFEAARSCYWMERSSGALRAAWRGVGLPDAVTARLLEVLTDETCHPKRRDAEYALRCVTASLWLS